MWGKYNESDVIVSLNSRNLEENHGRKRTPNKKDNWDLETRLTYLVEAQKNVQIENKSAPKMRKKAIPVL